MKTMKVARGTARAKRRTSIPMAQPSAEAQYAMAVDAAKMVRKLSNALFKKSASARPSKHSPFA